MEFVGPLLELWQVVRQCSNVLAPLAGPDRKVIPSLVGTVEQDFGYRLSFADRVAPSKAEFLYGRCWRHEFRCVTPSMSHPNRAEN